jgi:hypothetical protein
MLRRQHLQVLTTLSISHLHLRFGAYRYRCLVGRDGSNSASIHNSCVENTWLGLVVDAAWANPANCEFVVVST